MASSELTFEQIYQYFQENGGVVRNRDAVSAFKRYLTDPRSKDDARNKFRTYINTLAHTKKGENDEKFLVLKTKYVTSVESPLPLSPQYDPRNSVGLPLSPISSSDFSPQRGSPRQPPPYRPPPPVPASPCRSIDDNVSECSFSLDGTPLAPPRRRSADKQNLERGKSIENNMDQAHQEDFSTPKRNSRAMDSDDKENMTVKEKTQKFNRLASCDDELSPKPKSAEKKLRGVDDVDGALESPIDQKKLVEWYVMASKGEYQELLKLANAEPRLAKKKDPFTAYTVLHWGAKHGNEDIIKEFVGNYRVDVNARTNGGYTPLHIAAQFGQKQVYKLLVEVYKANESIRDYSGKTAEFYRRSKEPEGDVILRKKNRKKQSDKDLGFLRIGSLNVRVKKTTEAFSNFLGVGSGAITPLETMNEKVHKGWGSADNVTKY